MGGVVPAAGCGFRRACPWGGQRTLSRIHGRERMDGAQMEVASGWVGLSLRRILGFGERVRGVGRVSSHLGTRATSTQVVS